MSVALAAVTIANELAYASDEECRTLPGSEQTKEKVIQTGAYIQSTAMIADFSQINDIKNHFCAFHPASTDRTRHIESHHFCSHLTEEVQQCVIFSAGDEKDPLANRRLIGIEYIVSERIFKSLPDEEKKYWHSHRYEDRAEEPIMTQLYKTYGKTIHTWQPDIHPDLPIGPPELMMSYTADGQIPTNVVLSRDERCKIDTIEKRKYPSKYLDPNFQTNPKADQFETTGKAVQFVPQEVEVKRN
ncbi:BQ2448_863 [Microbotryum intermedium]|uniref:BQ2448_863 protein n=1 Tax=Microbotryum intermedium TaxID=269621 RepID=A0A238F3Q1_9BASI|nr:BQ2448_863 [Microbotryum intermedium]